MTQVGGSSSVGGVYVVNNNPSSVNVKESIADVINVLTGDHKKPEDIKMEMVSEEILYAAMVHSELNERSSGTGKAFIRELSEYYKKNLKSNKKAALYEAADQSLHRAVTRNMITGNQEAKIKDVAFGKAQLDRNKGNISNTLITPKTEANGQMTDNNIKDVISKSRHNSIATQNSVAKFDGNLAKNPVIKSDAKAEAQRHAYDDINKYVTSAAVATPTVTQPPPPSTTVTPPPVNQDTDIAAPKPSSTIPDTKDSDLVFIPSSTTDGNLVMYLPKGGFTNNVGKVVISDIDTGADIAELNWAGKGPDGRAHWRGASPGTSYGNSFWVKMFFTNGTIQTMRINNSSKYSIDSNIS